MKQRTKIRNSKKSAVIDFSCKYDIAVIGAGVAGVAAAVQAARRGHKTILLEKTVFPGGLASSGLIYVYLPLCDGRGRQVTYGIAEEMLKMSMKYGPGEIPPKWNSPNNADPRQRYQVFFSPASFTLALDEICEKAGVDTWLDSLVCSAELDADAQVRAIFVENKSGRGKIEADIFIDASGDADIARRVGAELESACNLLSSWVLEYDINAKNHSDRSLADKLGRHVLYETINPQAPLAVREQYRNINGAKVSKFLLDSRRKIREHYQNTYEKAEVNRHNFFPIALPSMPSFRMTYAVLGKDTLRTGQAGIRFENSIGLVCDWRKAGSVWEIPYGTLVPKKIRGLLSAGRCISSIDDAWEVTRVIPAAAHTGQVAGMAASLAIEDNILPDNIDVKLIQNELRKLGIPLHLSDVGL